MENNLVKTVTKDNFKKLVLESKEPVIVDFYAIWCGPCQYMEPTLEDAAEDFEGKINFFKVNIDESRDLAIEQNITSIPTLMFVKDGKVLLRHVGTLSLEEIEEKINTILLGTN
jgi:thioredoxin 1